MGTMGAGIAHALILGGIPVAVRDVAGSVLERGTAKIRASVEKRVAQGKLSADRAEAMLSLLTTTTEWEGIGEADLVVEAVVEDADVKRAVYARLEELCSDHALIASNTSTISLDVLADRMRRPERFIGLHFFSPAHRMPLVEVIRRDATPANVLATAFKLAKSIRKTPVLVRNREAFIVNRIFLPYVKEAFWLLEDGAAPGAVDAAMVAFGFPMGPLAVIDLTGVDILVLADRVMSRVFPAHGCVSPIAVRLAEQGHLGQKTGSGVYRYEKGDYTPHPSEATARVIAQVQQETGRAPREVGKDEIAQRLVLRMVNEAFWVMQEGIALRESDLDAAMVLGTGFPDFRGGVLKHARDIGLDTVLARLEELAERFGGRFAPCATNAQDLPF